MKKYNPNIHHRKSIRLKGYDYSQPGLYFVTICVQNRKCLFGHIENGKMILNDAGKMIEKWYHKLKNKFPDKKCHEMVVMPNHFHCIIENVAVGAVGADLCVCPHPADICVCPNNITNTTNPNNEKQSISGGTISDQTILGEQSISDKHIFDGTISDQTILGEHIGSPLQRVIQWFKTMTTNEYIRGVKNLNWQSFNGKLWQRNYWEHIIRNEQSFQRISEYIKNNPQNWNQDKLQK